LIGLVEGAADGALEAAVAALRSGADVGAACVLAEANTSTIPTLAITSIILMRDLLTSHPIAIPDSIGINRCTD
jgi:hypothetical protein